MAEKFEKEDSVVALCRSAMGEMPNVISPMVVAEVLTSCSLYDNSLDSSKVHSILSSSKMSKSCDGGGPTVKSTSPQTDSGCLGWQRSYAQSRSLLTRRRARACPTTIAPVCSVSVHLDLHGRLAKSNSTRYNFNHFDAAALLGT